MLKKITKIFSPHAWRAHAPNHAGLEILKYLGPGLLITVGFIDPGNWGANLAAGAEYGYTLLWMVSLATLMLIVLQHNAAHLGIVTGLCLSEAIMKYLPRGLALPALLSAVGASAATSMAELLGAAVALRMLFGIPLMVGASLTAALVLILLLSHSYKKVERWIIAFVSLIGLSFLYEMTLISPDWKEAAVSWVLPRFPAGSMVVIMSVLGAVVMPHNLFLHSEIIQSRQWNLQDEKIIQKELKYEFMDTLLSMMVGWAINSAMILLAAVAFFNCGTEVTELEQAKDLLVPLLGENAANIFAVALLMAGFTSSVTSAMAGGSIMAGIVGEPYNIKDRHTRLGIISSLGLALAAIAFVTEPLQGLIYSQMLLSVQLPITMLAQVYLTSSPLVMGKYANPSSTKAVLIGLCVIVGVLNVMLLVSAVI